MSEDHESLKNQHYKDDKENFLSNDAFVKLQHVESISFHTASQKFLQSIVSLGFAFPVSVNAIDKATTTEMIRLREDYLNGGGRIDDFSAVGNALIQVAENSPEVRRGIDVNISNSDGFGRMLKGFLRMNSAQKLVTRGFIITLEGQIDLLISDIVRVICNIKPHVMKFHSRQVALGDIITAGGLEEYKLWLVEQEIDVISRKGHVAQIEWIEERLKPSLKGRASTWKAFIELAERRNLFTHTDGRISRQYLKAAQEHKFDLPEGAELGKEVELTAEYFYSALDTALEHGMNILFGCWVFVDKQEGHLKIAQELCNLVHLMSENGHVTVAVKILENVSGQCNFNNEAKQIVSNKKIWLNTEYSINTA